MSEDNFKAKVTGLITIKEEKDRKMELETFKYWTELTNRSFVFNRVKNEIEQLRQVTKQQLINFIKEVIFTCSVLVVKGLYFYFILEEKKVTH